MAEASIRVPGLPANATRSAREKLNKAFPPTLGSPFVVFVQDLNLLEYTQSVVEVTMKATKTVEGTIIECLEDLCGNKKFGTRTTSGLGNATSHIRAYHLPPFVRVGPPPAPAAKRAKVVHGPPPRSIAEAASVFGFQLRTKVEHALVIEEGHVEGREQRERDEASRHSFESAFQGGGGYDSDMNGSQCNNASDGDDAALSGGITGFSASTVRRASLSVQLSAARKKDRVELLGAMIAAAPADAASVVRAAVDAAELNVPMAPWRICPRVNLAPLFPTPFVAHFPFQSLERYSRGVEVNTGGVIHRSGGCSGLIQGDSMCPDCDSLAAEEWVSTNENRCLPDLGFFSSGLTLPIPSVACSCTPRLRTQMTRISTRNRKFRTFS